MMDNALKQKIEQHHKEEISDHDTYLQMADELDAAGHHHFAGVVRDIAHDEKTHAMAIAHMMDVDG